MICPTCSKDLKWLEKHANEYECSHVDCPTRKQAVNPTDGMESALNWSNADFLRPGMHYRSTPKCND